MQSKNRYRHYGKPIAASPHFAACQPWPGRAWFGLFVVIVCWIGLAQATEARREAGWLGGLLLANWIEFTSGTVKEAWMILASLDLAGVRGEDHGAPVVDDVVVLVEGLEHRPLPQRVESAVLRRQRARRKVQVSFDLRECGPAESLRGEPRHRGREDLELLERHASTIWVWGGCRASVTASGLGSARPEADPSVDEFAGGVQMAGMAGGVSAMIPALREMAARMEEAVERARPRY